VTHLTLAQRGGLPSVHLPRGAAARRRSVAPAAIGDRAGRQVGHQRALRAVPARTERHFETGTTRNVGRAVPNHSEAESKSGSLRPFRKALDCRSRHPRDRSEGEPIRELTLDPSRNYQPLNQSLPRLQDVLRHNSDAGGGVWCHLMGDTCVRTWETPT
jgi:hypothetical protein